jgi:hypothetical protein
MSKPGEPYTANGLAIVNPYGGIWTRQLFDTPEAAIKYLRTYWGEKEDISRFKLAPAHLEVKLDEFGGKPRLLAIPTGE